MNTLVKSALAGAGLCAAVVTCPAAMAAGNALPAAPAGATTAAVTAADAAAKGSLGSSFASSLSQHGSAPQQVQVDKSGNATQRDSAPVNVYMLSEQFVKDGGGPVGQFAYAATSYRVDGNAATVYSVPMGAQWQGVNIATGTTEQGLASKGKVGSLLLEPQVHAYYAVKGDTVVALNESATKAIGGSSISMANYAKQVHAKYGAMLPGSAYDKAGYAGGFQDAPAGAQKADEPSASNESSTTRTAASIGGIALVGAGAFAWRRRQM